MSSEILRFVRTTWDINTFVTFFNHLSKRIQKQGSKHRSILSMLNEIFGKHFIGFNTFIFAFFYYLELELHIYMFAYCIVCFCYLLFLLVCFLFVWLSCYYCFCVICLCFYVSMYLHLLIFLWVDILHHNFTVWSIIFLETDISVYNLVLFIYYVLLFNCLLGHTCILMYVFLNFVALTIYNIYVSCLLFSLFVCMLIMVLLMLRFIYICFYIHMLLFMCLNVYIFTIFFYYSCNSISL